LIHEPIETCSATGSVGQNGFAEAFSKYASRTLGHVADKPPRDDLKLHSSTRARIIANPAGILTVNAARGVAAKWAGTLRGSSADLEHKLIAAQISTVNGHTGRDE
jgi:hypothetical protein